MATAAIMTFGIPKIEPYMNPELAKSLPVNLAANTNFARGTVLGELAGTNEQVQVAITGGPTGGTFTLTFGAQTTAAIPYGASALQVQDALEALSTIGDGNIAVTGGWTGGGAVFLLEFRAALGATDVGAVTGSVASLTGGTPAIAITVPRNGAAGTPGTWAAYDNDLTTGAGIARAILPYDVQTDGSGNITFSATGSQVGGEFGQQSKSVDVYVIGIFRTTELVGLDSVAVGQMGRLLSGTVADGILAIGL
jgi:hypothetical protein